MLNKKKHIHEMNVRYLVLREQMEVSSLKKLSVVLLSSEFFLSILSLYNSHYQINRLQKKKP